VTALFPGSFDPVTLGHIDLLRRAAPLFDEIIVAVMCNPKKQPLFTVEERLDILKKVTSDIKGLRIEASEGLLSEFAYKHKARYILRGIRSEADYTYELPMAVANRELRGRPETIFMISDPSYANMSAGLIKEIAAAGYPAGFDDSVLDKWVSKEVKKLLKNKFDTLFGGN